METQFKNLPDSPVRGIWAMLHGYRRYYIVSLVFLGIAIGGEVGGNLLIRHYVDTVIVEQTWVRPLALFAVAFLSVALIRGALSFGSGRMSAFAAESVIRRLRNSLYDHMQRLSFAYHDTIKTGELVQRSTSDVDTVRRFYAEQIRGLARIGFLFSINFAAILALEWRLALISIALVPVMAAASIYFFGRIYQAYEAYQEQDGNLSAVLQENLTGVRIVRAFARQEFESEKFEQENREKLRRGIRFLITHATYWPVSEFLGGVQIVAGLVAGGIMAMNGQITIGTYVAYVGIAKGIIWPLQQLGRQIAQLSTTSVSYGRICTILNQGQEDLDVGVSQGHGTISGKVEFRNVSFGYDHGGTVLKDVSFVCNRGQHVALLGEPGSGKTTLVNLLPRFYDYTAGEVLIDGRPAKDYSRQFLRRNIGIVEQEPFLFSTTIRNNITYGVEREVSDEEVVGAAQAAAIHDSIASFPKAYDTLVGERGVTLSGGQKQRIAIARTLLKDPAVLILDDSTSAVDAETEESIRSALRRLMDGRTTFIVAHRIQSLMTADLILVFKNGSIVQRGIHKDLIDQPGFYRKVFELQTRIEMELGEELIHG